MNFIEGTNIKQYEKEFENQNQKHLQNFEKELAKLKTGRAHPSMVEDVKVFAYGSLMPLKELAAISAPESTLIVIQPWDINIITDIEKSLSTSDIGVTPQNDGEVIRIKLPPMSSARREEIVKLLSQKLEACKVAIRNVRKDIQNKIREAEKAKKISEDYSERLQDSLQKITDKYIKESEQLANKKEAEIKNV